MATGITPNVAEFVRLSVEGKTTQLIKREFTSSPGAPVADIFSMDVDIEFDSSIHAVKMSANGDWQVTITVPSHQGETVVKMGRATGLNLRTRMVANGIAGTQEMS